MVRGKAPEVTIKKVGTSKQCSAHAIDNPAANLSVIGWIFIIKLIIQYLSFSQSCYRDYSKSKICIKREAFDGK